MRMVAVFKMKDKSAVPAVQRDVAMKCLDAMNESWYVKAKGYAKSVAPRTSLDEMTWF